MCMCLLGPLTQLKHIGFEVGILKSILFSLSTAGDVVDSAQQRRERRELSCSWSPHLYLPYTTYPVVKRWYSKNSPHVSHF